MEVEALGKHPGETTALKVDLQERQQFTAHLLDLIIMMYMYLSIFAAYTCCCQSKLLDCSASLKWRYPLCLQQVSTFCIRHSTPITIPILSHILFILYYMYQIKSKRMNFWIGKHAKLTLNYFLRISLKNKSSRLCLITYISETSTRNVK